MNDELQKKLDQLAQAHATGALDEETYQAAAAALQAAHPSQSGATASGENSTALGERAINVGGDVGGDVISGDHNKKVVGPNYERYYEAAPGEAVDSNALRITYLGRVLEQTRLLPLTGIDPAAVGEGDPDSPGGDRLPLKTVYTALLTVSSEGGGLGDLFDIGPGLLGRGRGHRSPISALQQLDQHPHLVLLGDPGSGKSTLANFVAACLAGAALGHNDLNLDLLTHPLPDEKGEDQTERQPWGHGPLLPLLVILRDLAAEGLPAPDQPATADHFWAFLEKRSHTPAFVPFLKTEFTHRGGLLLLDGLDEVPEAESRRRQIQALIADLKATLPLARILVTSRIYAYKQQEWSLQGFTAALLAPFTQGQIHRFIDRWYSYTAAQRSWTEAKAQQDAALLRQTIASRPELGDLAERPLLLTLMISLHAWRGGTLPGKRAQLYHETVDLLLDRWENLRAVKDPTSGRPLNKSLAEMLKVGKEALRHLLEKLAYEAHAAQPDADRNQPVDIPEQTLLNALLEISRRDDEFRPRLLAAYLRDRAGLLIDRGGGMYTFPHRTFQEFLAACYAADRGRSETLAAAARTDPSRWREVLLLSVAHASQNYRGAVWDFVPALCREEEETTADGHTTEAALWGTHLAGLALAEVETDPAAVPARDQAALRRVRQRLTLALADGRLPAVERAKAAVSLARLGDTRQELLAVDALPLAYVPRGPFWIGEEAMGQDEDPNIQTILDSTRPRHQLDIPYGYWLAQYPVTNAQYQQFVDAGGYQDAAYWSEAAAHGFWQKEGQVRGYTWIDSQQGATWLTRDCPYDYGLPFNLPNHPVVGLNWYEALAFTRWLTHRWQAAGWLPGPDTPQEWQVFLPSEAEWEKGARGGVQWPQTPLLAPLSTLSTLTPTVPLRQPDRAEPTWGPEQANQLTNKIGATNGLGCFPTGRSPYGCEEMVGNVWEWTRSLFGQCDRHKSEEAKRLVFVLRYLYPYQGEDGRERLDRDDSWVRVVRGSSWGSGDYWQYFSRNDNYPYLRHAKFGFRVCVRPHFPASGL